MKLHVFVVVGLLILCTPPSPAQPLVTFEFTDLWGEFVPGDPGTGQLVIDPNPDLTSGVVARTTAPLGTAEFNLGWVGQGAADAMLNMDLVNISGTEAQATGTLMILDLQGDALTADVEGTWTPLDTFASFAGLLGNIAFTNTSGDGEFNGPSGGSFDMAFVGPFEGALLSLMSGAWFDQSFTEINTHIEGSIVPEPSAALLLGALLLLRPGRRGIG